MCEVGRDNAKAGSAIRGGLSLLARGSMQVPGFGVQGHLPECRPDGRCGSGIWGAAGEQTKLGQLHLLQEGLVSRGAPAAGEGVMVTSTAGAVHKRCESCEHVPV